MRYGIIISLSNVRDLVEAACEAEAAGWDALFVADALAIGTDKFPDMPWFDPWVALAAIAARTERIRIGTLLTPPSRRAQRTRAPRRAPDGPPATSLLAT